MRSWPKPTTVWGWPTHARGEAAEALSALRQALALRPDFPKAHINAGVLLEEQGRLAEALDHFRRAVDLVPDDARALNNIVIALSRAGRVDEARKVLEQAQAPAGRSTAGSQDAGEDAGGTGPSPSRAGEMVCGRCLSSSRPSR